MGASSARSGTRCKVRRATLTSLAVSCYPERAQRLKVDVVKTNQWVKLASYPTVFDAERAKATLDSAGIPALLQSHGGAGALGTGFQGPVPGGVVLQVQAEDLDRAWTLVVENSV